MHRFFYRIVDRIQLLRWVCEEKATAAIETVVLFPVLITLMMGCFDLGQGILMNQKTIGASQIIADLIAREKSTTMAELQDLIVAGELVFEPYSTTDFGYDIASIQFDATGQPVVLWRVTHNAPRNDDAVDSTIGLGPPGDGIVVVTTVYNYQPYFSNFVVDRIDMKEVAFLRGRKGPTVTCADCPV